jgi:hypothetical protein
MVRGLEKILTVHNDASIPDGTLVQVNPSTPSRYHEKPLVGVAAGGPTEEIKRVDATS